MIRDSARLHDESIGIFRALEAESTLKVQVNSPMVHATNRALNDAILLKEKGEKQAAAKLLHAKLSDQPKEGARGLRLSVLVALATVDNSFRQQAANLIEELAAALPMELKRSFRNRSDISVLTALKTE